MTLETDPFPDWHKPATKGDLITTLVATRTCIVDIWVALSRLQRGDSAGFAEKIADLDASDDRLKELIAQFSGRQVTHGE